MLVLSESTEKLLMSCLKEKTFTLHRWMGNCFVVTARNFVSNGGSMATLSVFVMCWRTKMPRLNSADLWQNTTDISVRILYHLPRKECKSLLWYLSLFLFLFFEFQFLLERFRPFFDVNEDRTNLPTIERPLFTALNRHVNVLLPFQIL